MWPAAAWSSLISRAARSPPGEGRVWMMRVKRRGCQLKKWRTGCEGRISVVKRRHGLGRSRYKGDTGIKRWVGLGVIADNLVNISRVMAKRPSR
jgi:hypothetical protein